MEDLERPKKCPDSWLFFASYYSEPMITMFFDTDVIEEGHHPVYACTKDSTEIIMKWKSFNEWFSSEVTRMSSLFDENGIFISDEKEYIPYCNNNLNL